MKIVKFYYFGKLSDFDCIWTEIRQYVEILIVKLFSLFIQFCMSFYRQDFDERERQKKKKMSMTYEDYDRRMTYVIGGQAQGL